MIERLGKRTWEETNWKFFEEIENEMNEHGIIKQDYKYRYLLINYDGELEVYRRKLR